MNNLKRKPCWLLFVLILLLGLYPIQTVSASVNNPAAIPLVEFSASSSTAWEDVPFATITVTISESSSEVITVQLDTSSGTAAAGNDYIPTSRLVLFAPGETSKVLEVGIHEDTLVEDDEYFVASLSAPTNAELGSRITNQITILDNDGFFDGGIILPGQYATYHGRAWGDYDNDGDLDIVFSYSQASGKYTRISQNQGDGTFTVIDPGFPGVDYSEFEWGDSDNDGDLDLLFIGRLPGTLGNYISTIYRNNGNGTFTDINPGFPSLIWASGAWGDYNNDGNLDLLLIGQPEQAGMPRATRVYRNNGNGTFTDIGADLYGVQGGDCAWGDYDNDGDLDILLTGYPNVSKVYRNDGNGQFIDINAGLIGTGDGSVAWGDYDNDGDLDILLTGCTAVNCPSYVARVYRNNGNHTFTDIAAGFPGAGGHSVSSWGDYDNDGDLDILLTGVQSSPAARVFRNNGYDTFTDISAIFTGGMLHHGATAWGDADNDGDLDILLYYNIFWNRNRTVNLKPSSPNSLASSYQGNSIQLSWNLASDDHTPTAGMTYNVRVGTYPGGSNIFSGMAMGNGYRYLPAMGNSQQGNTTTLTNLTWDRTYYWSVQAIDSAFVGSAFSQEATFGLAAVHLSQSAYSVSEDASSAPITVTLTAASPTAITVEYHTLSITADGTSDYTPITGTLTFEPGETSKELSVPILDDTTDENDETFMLSIADPVNATLSTPSTAVITILDNDPLPIIQLDASTISANENDGIVTITATLSTASAKTISVYFRTSTGTASEGDDYTPITGALTFEPGEIVKYVEINIVDDQLVEPTEDFAFVLEDLANATLGLIDTTTIYINDNDPVPANHHVFLPIVITE